MNKALFTVHVTVKKLLLLLIPLVLILAFLGRYAVRRVAFENSFIEFEGPFATIEEIAPQLAAYENAGIEYELRPSGYSGAEDKLGVYIRAKDTDAAHEVRNLWWMNKSAA